MKFCSKCQTDKEFNAFGKRAASKDGYCSWCKACMRQYRFDNKDRINARVKVYRDKNRNRVREWDRKKGRKYTLARYGLSESDYAKMVAAQDGLCKICNIAPDDNLVVDHCHDTEEVRGLLCRQCNMALGIFKDSVETLQSAIVYLS